MNKRYWPLGILTISLCSLAQTPESQKIISGFKTQLVQVENLILKPQLIATSSSTEQEKLMKMSCFLDNLSFDIKKSDSLVSPYVAVVTANTIQEWDGPFDTEAQAWSTPSALLMSRTMGKTKIKLEYAMQDNQWVLKNGAFNRKGFWHPVWEGPKGKEDPSFCLIYNYWNRIK